MSMGNPWWRSLLAMITMAVSQLNGQVTCCVMCQCIPGVEFRQATPWMKEDGYGNRNLWKSVGSRFISLLEVSQAVCPRFCDTWVWRFVLPTAPKCAGLHHITMNSPLTAHGDCFAILECHDDGWAHFKAFGRACDAQLNIAELPGQLWTVALFQFIFNLHSTALCGKSRETSVSWLEISWNLRSKATHLAMATPILNLSLQKARNSRCKAMHEQRNKKWPTSNIKDFSALFTDWNCFKLWNMMIIDDISCEKDPAIAPALNGWKALKSHTCWLDPFTSSRCSERCEPSESWGQRGPIAAAEMSVTV